MGLKISIGKQIVDLKKLQNYEDKVKKMMNDMNEKKMIFFSLSIQNFINLKLLKKNK